MASATEIAKQYFAAVAARDVDAMERCWAPGGIERIGSQELSVPYGLRQYFGELFDAFPDLAFEVLDVTGGRGRVAVRWRARGTFAGPGRFQGLEPNGGKLELEGCDVLTIAEDRIQRNDVYIDSGEIARQLGVLPAVGSSAEARLTRLANLGSRVRRVLAGGPPEPVAEGVWVVRGGFPLRTMNVYLLRDDGGVTVFDAGIAGMAGAVRSAAARLGGIKRVVLGHADADHRGSAPALGAPVYCHPSEREAAQLADPFRPYFDLSKLGPHGRFLLSRLLPVWDGGPVEVAGTVEEGEEVAGFRVVELPGHAPGLIGLFRDSDRLALASDCVYTLDPQTGIKGAPRVPHPAFNVDTELARESIRKLADLQPSAAWFGHADPLTGEVAERLRQAAGSQ
jgi:hydroxyacylglutathione hydrolase